MKKLILLAVALCCASAIVVQAQDAPKKHKLTAEQKQVMADMLAKYDTNKDGKLDKAEKSAMSAEDKAAYAKAFPAHGKKKAEGSSSEATSTNAPATDK